MHRPRSVEEIIEEQARRWQAPRASAAAETPHPVIAVSREHGARGRDVARAVATSLGLECYDREILTRIAQEAHIAERLVSPLDERDARTWLSDWVVPLITGSYLTPYGYLHHLARVVDHIARSQGGVILGRGAHLILRPGRALRVRVVAPLAVRVATVAAREGLSEAAARRRVVEVERERQAFLQRCFRAPLDDASTFDLQVNTGVIGVEGAVGAVCVAATALAGLRPRTGGTASVPEAPAALDARR